MRATGIPTPTPILAPRGKPSEGFSWLERSGAFVPMLVGLLADGALVSALGVLEPVGVVVAAAVDASLDVVVDELTEDDDGAASSTWFDSM